MATIRYTLEIESRRELNLLLEGLGYVEQRIIKAALKAEENTPERFKVLERLRWTRLHRVFERLHERIRNTKGWRVESPSTRAYRRGYQDGYFANPEHRKPRDNEA